MKTEITSYSYDSLTGYSAPQKYVYTKQDGLVRGPVGVVGYASASPVKGGTYVLTFEMTDVRLWVARNEWDVFAPETVTK